MAEPASSSAVALSMTAVLVAFEAATGISPMLFGWGAVGGFWAFRYLDAMTWQDRASSLGIAALIGGVFSYPAAIFAVALAKNYLAWWPVVLDAAQVSKPVAAVIGLLCHRVIGRKLIELAERKAEEVAR